MQNVVKLKDGIIKYRKRVEMLGSSDAVKNPAENAPWPLLVQPGWVQDTVPGLDARDESGSGGTLARPPACQANVKLEHAVAGWKAQNDKWLRKRDRGIIRPH